ncbi:MAG: redoxin domain-containing protein [Gemmatimonadota bacterium]
MQARIATGIVVTLVLLGTGAMAYRTLAAPALVAPEAPGAYGFRPGELAHDFNFRTVDGTRGRLSGLLEEHRAVVVVMRTTECPVSRQYGHRLAELERAYAERGVAFLYLNASPQDTPDKIREDIATFDLAGPYVADPDGEIATLLQAEVSTEVFIIDAARTLRYRGAVDDQFGISFAKPEPREHYLVAALDAVLDERPVAVSETEASGCYLELAAQQTALVPERPVTYHERVGRIIQENCVSCHRAGGVAPFSLETYEDVYGFRGMVRFVLEEGRMPPWFANPEHGAFRNDPSLPERDRRDVLAWLEAGAPAGDPGAAPRPLVWVDGWQLGREPDAVVELPEPQDVPASGVVDYRYIFVKTDFQEDRWIRQIEARPTAPQVTHHVIAYLQGPDDEGRGAWLGATAPGVPANVFPDGTAKRLPAGAWIMFEVHYTPNGTATRDQTRLGLVFADGPPVREVETTSVSTTRFAIPPGAANHEVVARRGFERAGSITAMLPHMHVRGKAFRYEVERTDGTREILLDIPRYDFNWQLFYEPAEPVHVAPGDELVGYAWYDNSAGNPANPDPTATVRFGEQTFEEMMFGFFDFVPDEPLAARGG